MIAGKSSLRKRNTLLIVSRVFATVLALFYFVSFVPKLIDQYFCSGENHIVSDGSWEGWVMELTFWIFFVGYTTSWFKKFAGGIILIIASLVQMLPFLIIDGNLGSLIFGLPTLIAGILFLACKRL